MGWFAPLLFVLFIGGLCSEQNISGDEFLSVMRTIVEGQNKMQQRLTGLNSNIMRITDFVAGLRETVQDLQAEHREIKSAVNATKLLLEDGHDSSLNLDMDTSSTNNSLNNTCIGKDKSDVPIDRALGKPTMPKWHSNVMASELVVDGDNGTHYRSFGICRPWWSVDLLDTYLIKTIDILPHPSVPTHFRNVKVYIGNSQVTDGDFESYYIAGKHPGPWNGEDRVVYNLAEGVCGRYVAVQGFSGYFYLNLVDVKVFA